MRKSVRKGSEAIVRKTVVRLGFRSPGIVTAIIDGSRPLELSADRLLREGSVSPIWSERLATRGFV
jgi:hypothetical protein